jgi:hypothetical protein
LQLALIQTPQEVDIGEEEESEDDSDVEGNYHGRDDNDAYDARLERGLRSYFSTTKMLALGDVFAVSLPPPSKCVHRNIRVFAKLITNYIETAKRYTKWNTKITRNRVKLPF